MKISTKGRYALRLMLELCRHNQSSFVPLTTVSQNQNISKKYLEQIVPLLNKSGLLQTNRGNHGGYRLAVSPAECTVGDILRAAEGNLAPVSCLDAPQNACPQAGSCVTLFVWQGLDKVISDYLDSITLQDVFDHSNSANDSDNYCI